MSNTDLEYKKILEDRVKNNEKKIQQLSKNNKKFRVFGEHKATTIRGLEVENEALKKQIEDYEDREKLGNIAESSLEAFDHFHDKNKLTQEDYRKKIEELKVTRSKLETLRAKRIVDKRIELYEKRIERLKKRNVHIGNTQRRMIYPKYRYELKKQNLLAHASGRVAEYEAKVNDNQELINMLDPSSRKLDSVRGVIYDMKGIFYKKRLERSNEILDEIQNRNLLVTMYGARVTSLGKRYLDKVRNNNPVVTNTPNAQTR